MPVPKALDIAAGLSLDLVEVSPQAKPPVCKIMDYGRFKYELTKKQQEARKKQTVVQLKEVKVRPKTGDHDLETKLKNIRKFIEKRNKVKVTVMFRGREITMSDRGRSVLESIIADVEDVAVVESTPKFEGRTMMMILVPKT
ncbi:translation initiation factor 3 (bIF-3) [Desulfobotulus alkaliphilus]|uniref:Translation initiation factor IF-3 n=2 Tax=Desulfobotulus alkaliphilus TaxID=622671 RepID=A0A562RCB3_9BACT|nr:translation initiation factor 3 (bIF-3) [Desulfobotulus alkaliphilus]